eukprot:scaffold155_cov347-Pavlova_lutheri.AAC.25
MGNERQRRRQESSEDKLCPKKQTPLDVRHITQTANATTGSTSLGRLKGLNGHCQENATLQNMVQRKFHDKPGQKCSKDELSKTSLGPHRKGKENIQGAMKRHNQGLQARAYCYESTMHSHCDIRSRE